MTPNQGKPDSRRTGRQASALKDHGKRPQGVAKHQLQAPTRRSPRLKKTDSTQRPNGKDSSTQPLPFPSPSISNPRSIQDSPANSGSAGLQRAQQQQHKPISGTSEQKEQLSSNPVGSLKDSEGQPDLPASEKHSGLLDPKYSRKRKRSEEAESPLAQSPAIPPPKQQRTSLANSVVKDAPGQAAARDISSDKINSISYWVREGNWPEKYKSGGDFEQENDMSHVFARKRSTPSLRRKQSDSSDVTPSDQNPREEKSAPYRHPGYETLLATKGSYMDNSDLGVTDTSKGHCQTLLNTKQKMPQDSIFRDDCFDEICRSVHAKNEARVIRDISPLICPSAEILAICDGIKPKLLIDSVNEGWNNSIPVTKTRPQPDYSVGFRRSAFTDDQLKKLEPFIGGIYDMSFFMATYYMYFPFLTCEVKCGAAALDVADRQNAHSMTLAVRGVVELFKYVKCEKEIDREILGFSISHDHSMIRIYGHYAVIKKDKTAFYRHPIKEFSFTSENGKEKWTAYNFTKNVYRKWMPDHLKKICSAIDKIPADINFGVLAIDSTINTDIESELPDSREIATSAPSSQNTTGFKKPRLRPTVMLQQEIERQRQENAELKDQLKQDREQLKQNMEQIKGLMDLLKGDLSGKGARD